MSHYLVISFDGSEPYFTLECSADRTTPPCIQYTPADDCYCHDPFVDDPVCEPCLNKNTPTGECQAKEWVAAHKFGLTENVISLAVSTLDWSDNGLPLLTICPDSTPITEQDEYAPARQP